MVWTAPQVERPFKLLETPAGDERALADGWLDHHRRTLLWKCEGLTAEQLKQRAVEPSTLTLLGLVRHMAEVERDWFRTRFAGEKVGYLYVTDDDLTAEFDVDGADAEADYATYVREIETIRRLLAGRPLDEVYFDPRRETEMNLRWVYSAMIQEYARHNGHADLLRESIDGRTGQ
jgi:uncharacterized damage-inducible protein DinB